MTEAERAATIKQCEQIEQGLKSIAASRAPAWGRRCLAEIAYIEQAKRLGWSEDEEMVQNAEKLVPLFAREAFAWAYFIVGRD